MNYLVKNANHKQELMSISTTDDELMIRLWARYDGPTNGFVHVNESTILTNVTEYPGQAVYIEYNGGIFQQKWYKSLCRSENQLEVGATYMFVSNDEFFYTIRLDSERYPNVKLSDWKFARDNSLRPLFKIQITEENQAFADMNKVYYLHKSDGSTAFITADELPVESLASDISLLPKFSYSVADNDVITITCDKPLNTKLRIFDACNIHLNQCYMMKNGQCIIVANKDLANEAASFSVLFGYSEVATVVL